ncbi:MAG: hypothetical protein A2474_06730 [Elusimicrobia bacterium RIFOXYC2_FULL_34_12]|nr:MAG: hypothetical protein A2474_06730 [Elusimicrobia bacterium RIFOXYC2_FULL_34_12]
MNKKAFVIDDDKNIIELFKYTLEREGFTVASAFNDIDIEKKILDEKPDIVILDLMLPTNGGFAILKTLQKNETTKNIPVLVISGRFTDGTTYDFINSQPNVKGFTSKPIDPSIFILEIKKIFGGTIDV